MAKRRASLIVVDDDLAIIRLVAKCLAKYGPGLRVTACERDAQAAVAAVAEAPPDAVLMDIHMPGMDPFDACERIREIAPGTRIVLYSDETRDTYVARALELRCAGYVTKDEDIDTVARAVHHVLAGHTYWSPRPAARLAEFEDGELKSRLHLLSHRELRVLREFARCGTRKEVAERLEMTRRAVQKELADIAEKIGMDSRYELTMFAVQEGLLHPGTELETVSAL